MTLSAVRPAPAGLGDAVARTDVVLVYRVAAPRRFEYVNDAVAAMTGYAPREFYDDPAILSTLVHRDDQPLLDAVLDPEDEAAITPVLMRWVKKSGSVIWVEHRGFGVRDESGQVVTVSAVVRESIRRAGEAAVVVPEAPAARVLTHGTLVVDCEGLTATSAGRHVDLTLKEFLLLRDLVRHRGRAVSREALLERVWGYSYPGGVRTVDVHICRLRQKLPELASSLRTLRHFGYKLVDLP